MEGGGGEERRKRARKDSMRGIHEKKMERDHDGALGTTELRVYTLIWDKDDSTSTKVLA